MTKEEITAWATANGWQMMDGYLSLTKPAARPRPTNDAAAKQASDPAIVRLVLKATVASVEIKKPAGKWEKVAGESYSKITPDPETGMPGGLGFATISGLTLLMRDNKDRQVFSRMAKG